MPLSESGKNVVMVSMPAPRRLLTATPASTSVILDAPFFAAIRYTTITVTTAPINAAAGMADGVFGNRAIASTAAKPAPEFTPMILGAAKGFSRTDCIITPDTARALPARIDAATRGSLANNII